MADLVLEETIEFASGAYLSSGAVIFLPNSIQVNEEVNYGNSYLASGLIVFTPQSITVSEDLNFGSFFQSAGGGGALHVFTPGIAVNELVLPYVNGDNTRQIVYEVTVTIPPYVPIYPNSGYNIEILYPIVPILVSGKEVHKLDSGLYKQFTKTCPDQIYSTLKLRVHSNSISNFLAYLKNNRTNIVNLFTPAMYPFGNGYINSYVYIISYSKPQLEKPQYWRLDVTFLYLTGIS